MECKTEGIPSICSNMGGPGEHNAKWNELDKERQILHAIPYMGKSFFKKKSQTHKNKVVEWLPRAGGRERKTGGGW